MKGVLILSIFFSLEMKVYSWYLQQYNDDSYRLISRRLREGRKPTYDRLLEALGFQPAREDQEDRTCKQFVFQRQCWILGESEIGKTSLVKSLTGKPFDPEEPKTQGIDQSLVNETWQNFLYLESSVDSLKSFRSVNHFWKGWKCYCSGVHEFNCWVIVPTWPILLFYNVKPGILPST